MYNKPPRFNENRKPGELYYVGPNYTVDPVVIAQSGILLVRRRDNGLWALPGGFIDFGETPTAAGAREVKEETGVTLACPADPEPVYVGKVKDQRSSETSWIETTALLWKPSTKDKPVAGTDAADARWFSLDQIPCNLNGSHGQIITRALERIKHGKECRT